MRATAYLRNYVPLIKFVGGPHKAPKNLSHEIKPHPCAPDGLLPTSETPKLTYFNNNPIEPEEGVYFSRAQLSKRFRYHIPSEKEIDDVLSGGAEVVF